MIPNIVRTWFRTWLPNARFSLTLSAACLPAFRRRSLRGPMLDTPAVFRDGFARTLSRVVGLDQDQAPFHGGELFQAVVQAPDQADLERSGQVPTAKRSPIGPPLLEAPAFDVAAAGSVHLHAVDGDATLGRCRPAFRPTIWRSSNYRHRTKGGKPSGSAPNQGVNDMPSTSIRKRNTIRNGELSSVWFVASGKCYQFENVPPETFAAFKAAFVNAAISTTTSAIRSDTVWLRPATTPDDSLWSKPVIQAGGDAMSLQKTRPTTPANDREWLPQFCLRSIPQLCRPCLLGCLHLHPSLAGRPLP